MIRPWDHQNRVRHIEKPLHTNFELIWFRERQVMTILRKKHDLRIQAESLGCQHFFSKSCF